MTGLIAQLLARRLLLVTGKGGTGKTSVAAALGRLAADAGVKTLVVELGHASVLPDLLCEGRPRDRRAAPRSTPRRAEPVHAAADPRRRPARVPRAADPRARPGAGDRRQRGLQALPRAADASLAGTSWQLVKIMSMHDTTYAPSDPLRYTLEFGTDGSVRLRTDCNSGTGSWSSESAGQLRFGIIAATRAQCPPGSLDDRYLGQFQWVRSYVMEDGRLFLATMADGSIIEFEPVTGAP